MYVCCLFPAVRVSFRLMRASAALTKKNETAENIYCFGGAEESKGGDGEEGKGGDAPSALPHAVAPVGAPSVYSCGGAKESI